MRHIDELRILLADTPVDILSINETRLDDSVKDSDVYIPQGMKLFAGTGKQMVDLVGVFVSTFALTLLILCDLI